MFVQYIFCVFTMYNTGWAKTRRALDCVFTIMAEISGWYWQRLDRSGKKIILLSPLPLPPTHYDNTITPYLNSLISFTIWKTRNKTKLNSIKNIPQYLTSFKNSIKARLLIYEKRENKTFINAIQTIYQAPFIFINFLFADFFFLRFCLFMLHYSLYCLQFNLAHLILYYLLISALQHTLHYWNDCICMQHACLCMPRLINWCPWNKASLLLLYIWLTQNIFHHFRPVAPPSKVGALERVVDKNKKRIILKRKLE